MDIKIDPDAMREVVAAAIMEKVTEEQRDAILSQAVQALIDPPPRTTGTFGTPGFSPLQVAFNEAVKKVAESVVGDLLDDPENPLRAKVLEFTGSAIAEMAKGNYDGLPEAIGKGIGEAVSTWLQDKRRGYAL